MTEMTELLERYEQLVLENAQLLKDLKNMKIALDGADEAAKYAVTALEEYSNFIPLGKKYMKTKHEDGELGYEIQGTLNHLNDVYGYMP